MLILKNVEDIFKLPECTNKCSVSFDILLEYVYINKDNNNNLLDIGYLRKKLIKNIRNRYFYNIDQNIVFTKKDLSIILKRSH